MENKKMNTTTFYPFVASTTTYPNIAIRWI